MNNIESFIESVSEERRDAMKELLSVLRENIPHGFEESYENGMFHFVVPLSLFPQGYHCTPGKPLPFISIASQKNAIVVHHLGIYASEHLREWLEIEYPKHSTTKLDMGKGCVRFKKIQNIPYKLLGELAQKITPNEWIRMYESAFVKK